QYLETSRQAEGSGGLRTLVFRWWAYAATGVCVALLLLAGVAIVQWWKAEESARRAEESASVAELKRREAEKARKAAEDAAEAAREARNATKQVSQNYDEFAKALRRHRVRPVQPGTSVSGPTTVAGTICCLARDRDNRPCLVSSMNAILS